MKLVITGANSAVGRAILRLAVLEPTGAEGGSGDTLIAAVRSERAADEIADLLGGGKRIARIAYDDPASLDSAFEKASAVVHLPGILVERPGSTYEQANVATTRAVVDAARRQSVGKLVLVSANAANEKSANRYWRTKGEAEALVRASGLPFTILRAPLLLGAGTEGAAAVERNVASGKTSLIAGGRTLQQPLFVDDLARAVLAATRLDVAPDSTLDVVGPVVLSDRAILERAAQLAGCKVRIGSVPKPLLSFVLALRGVLQGWGGKPGFSRDALDVITADTRLDHQPAARALGIELTGIDEMIRSSLEPNSGRPTRGQRK